jgi:Tfp pilus assembly protein PilO
MAIGKPQNSSFNAGTIISVVLLILVVVGITMFVLPLRSEFETSNQALTQKNTELSSLKTQLTQLQSVETSFQGGEVTRKDILNLIPEDLNQDEIIEVLAKVTDDNAVLINSLSFGLGTSGEADVEKISITLNITGAHQKIIDFLADIEGSSRKFTVNTIGIQIMESRLENVSISMEAYFT